MEAWRLFLSLGNEEEEKTRPFQALIPIPSPRIPQHDFPRLTTEENTEIEQAHNTPVSKKQAPNAARTETGPPEKIQADCSKSSRDARVVPPSITHSL